MKAVTVEEAARGRDHHPRTTTPRAYPALVDASPERTPEWRAIDESPGTYANPA